MRERIFWGTSMGGRMLPTPKVWQGLLAVSVSVGLLGGCVSSEKYESEKARALNFQRLLAQEEKRTGELNAQVQEARRQVASIELQNKDLTTELQALREQMVRAQEDLLRTRDGVGEIQDTQTEDLTLSEPSLSEFGLSDLGFDESDFQEIGSGDAMTHTVEKGETLYRLSRQYGVTVANLKQWNNLNSNLISIGQKLIVSQP